MKIKQIPIYDTETEFILSATEFTEFIRIAESYSRFMPFFENMIAKFCDSGQISIMYQDSEGNEMTKEEVENYLKSSLDSINDSSSIEPII